MNSIVEPQISWSPDQMIEITLNEPDDFLKVRETLTRIGVASRKEKKYINLVIFFINKVDITSFILKNYLHWMVRELILLLMMYREEIALSNYFWIGD